MGPTVACGVAGGRIGRRTGTLEEVGTLDVRGRYLGPTLSLPWRRRWGQRKRAYNRCVRPLSLLGTTFLLYE